MENIIEINKENTINNIYDFFSNVINIFHNLLYYTYN